HAARVPSEFTRRLESEHAARDGRAERLPFEFSVRREVGRIAANEIYVGAVAVPFGPLSGANEPSPNALRRSRNRNFVARINGRVVGLESCGPFHRGNDTRNRAS